MQRGCSAITKFTKAGVITGTHSPPVCGRKSKVGVPARLVPPGAVGKTVSHASPPALGGVLASSTLLGWWTHHPTPALLFTVLPVCVLMSTFPLFIRTQSC